MVITNVTLAVPSPQLDPAEIVRETLAVALQCNANLLPFARIRRRSKTRAERKHVERVRQAVYQRSGGLCELHLSPKWWGKAPWDRAISRTICTAAAAGSGANRTASG